MSKNNCYYIMRTDFTRLDFFSKHFNVPENRLHWCILEKTVTPEYHQFLLGLSIDNSKLVISVQDCCLRRLKRGSLKAHRAFLRPNKRRFYLKSEKRIYKKKFYELSFTKKNLADLYHDKWYDEADAKEKSTAL